MLVPVEIQNETYLFQLDTGADASLVYLGTPLAIKLGLSRHKQRVELEASMISSQAQKFSFFGWESRSATPGATSVSGIIGGHSLLTSRLTIDFRNSQVCREQLSKPMAEEGDYQFCKGSVRKMRFYLPVTWNGKTHDFIFDSGASAFDLITDEIYWRDLVGAVPGEYSEVVVQGARTQITAAGAKLHLNSIQVGTAIFKKLRVYYMKNDPKYFANWTEPTQGLIGNSLFFDRKIVIEYGENPRMGISKAAGLE